MAELLQCKEALRRFLLRHVFNCSSHIYLPCICDVQDLEKGTWALYICKLAGDLYKDHVLKLNVFRSCISLPSLVLGGPAMLACVPDETFARDIFLKRTPPTLQADWPRHDLEHSVKTWLYNSIVGRNIRMVALQWSFCESGHIVILLKTWRSKCLIWMLEWHPPPVYVIPV